jgi:NADP-dependent 3-hydroxy acid dehydrogenase YdfG
MMSVQGLAGKTVVVTGAGRGLGAAFSSVLTELGARVIMTGRNPEALGATAEAIRARYCSRPRTEHLDLSDPGEVTRWAKGLRDAGEPIDVLINNGAQWLKGPMDSHDAYSIVTTITSGVTGTLLLTRGLLPLLEPSGAGDILTIVSTAGLPNASLSGTSIAFLAAKHGQAGLVDGLRQELKDRPVRVSAIYPPNLDDLSPLEPDGWNAERGPVARANNRDVIDAALFILTRPRHLTFASIVIDSSADGQQPS